jgi:5-methylcytosine-specific restriction endonuclease McrA
MENTVGAMANRDRLTLPILRLGDHGEPAYVQVDSPIFKIEVKGKPSLEWMDVTDLSSGTLRSMRAQTVLSNDLRANYPANGYVGRQFEIKKHKPQSGKQYARFTINEIRLISQPPSRSDVQPVSNEVAGRLNQEQKNPTIRKGSTTAIDPLTLSYEEYRQTPLWRKIKTRVLKRDGKLCFRCGGKATLVHHRSYADKVMLGNGDGKLASVCEGCHTIIHKDESGNDRPMKDWDSVLLEKDERANFPELRIDRRRDRFKQIHPGEWPRMTALQRFAWEEESQRQFGLWRLHRASGNEKASEVFRRSLREHHGMDDQAIDSELAQLSKRNSGKPGTDETFPKNLPALAPSSPPVKSPPLSKTPPNRT